MFIEPTITRVLSGFSNKYALNKHDVENVTILGRFLVQHEADKIPMNLHIFVVQTQLTRIL